jgi:hypothetical protein
MAAKPGVGCRKKNLNAATFFTTIENQMIRRIAVLSVANRDFELDSKFDFLYSELLKHSRLSGQFNADPMLTGNTII